MNMNGKTIARIYIVFVLCLLLCCWLGRDDINTNNVISVSSIREIPEKSQNKQVTQTEKELTRLSYQRFKMARKASYLEERAKSDYNDHKGKGELDYQRLRKYRKKHYDL